MKCVALPQNQHPASSPISCMNSSIQTSTLSEFRELTEDQRRARRHWDVLKRVTFRPFKMGERVSLTRAEAKFLRMMSSPSTGVFGAVKAAVAKERLRLAVVTRLSELSGPEVKFLTKMVENEGVGSEELESAFRVLENDPLFNPVGVEDEVGQEGETIRGMLLRRQSDIFDMNVRERSCKQLEDSERIMGMDGPTSNRRGQLRRKSGLIEASIWKDWCIRVLKNRDNEDGKAEGRDESNMIRSKRLSNSQTVFNDSTSKSLNEYVSHHNQGIIDHSVDPNFQFTTQSLNTSLKNRNELDLDEISNRLLGQSGNSLQRETIAGLSKSPRCISNGSTKINLETVCESRQDNFEESSVESLFDESFADYDMYKIEDPDPRPKLVRRISSRAGMAIDPLLSVIPVETTDDNSYTQTEIIEVQRRSVTIPKNRAMISDKVAVVGSMLLRPFFCCNMDDTYVKTEEAKEGTDNDDELEALNPMLSETHTHLSAWLGPPEDYPVLGLGNLGDNGNDPLDPHVLSPLLMKCMREHLPYSLREENFWLKYSLLRDGASLEAIFKILRHSQHTVLAIETTQGQVFGSFTSTPWRNNGNNYYGSCEAFVWNLRKTRDVNDCLSLDEYVLRESSLDVFPWNSKNGNRNVQLSNTRKLFVGGGEPIEDQLDNSEVYCDGKEEKISNVNSDEGLSWGMALALDKDLIFGTSSRCATFDSNPLIDGSREAQCELFEIMNIEVWTLTPCMTEDLAEVLELGRTFVMGSS